MGKVIHLQKIKNSAEKRVNKAVAKPSKASPAKSKPKTDEAQVNVMNWKEAEEILREKGYRYQEIHDTITNGPFWVYYVKKPRELAAVISADWEMAARLCGAAVHSKITDAKIKSVVVSFSESISDEKQRIFANALVLSNYETNFKTDGSSGIIDQIKFEKGGSDQIGFRQHVEMAKATNAARTLINTRGTVADPDYVEEEIKKVFDEYDGNGKVVYESIVGDDLEKRGLNMIYNVGKGASSPPRLVIVEYIGAPKSKEKIALVGKGITYDTGGLHLKLSHGMDKMYYDKAGASAVLGAMKGTFSLQLKVNVCFVFTIAENAIGSDAYKPSDVIKSYSGKTVEITNTDAEGRNALCDAMTYVQRHYGVKEMVDIATLTGAIKTALGVETAGIFSNNYDFANDIQQAGQ